MKRVGAAHTNFRITWNFQAKQRNETVNYLKSKRKNKGKKDMK